MAELRRMDGQPGAPITFFRVFGPVSGPRVLLNRYKENRRLRPSSAALSLTDTIVCTDSSPEVRL